ncbi:hypothetical protein [Bradyrhizobium zhanjiangense]|uniref:hypothetical protein n=1 Tax=Bradyrhizobium zhanjiangense TaxID=1325107 RepID=UPI0010092006|nr:hypothetical protein [Bradyrhizobium zhanjiangense]
MKRFKMLLLAGQLFPGQDLLGARRDSSYAKALVHVLEVDLGHWRRVNGFRCIINGLSDRFAGELTLNLSDRFPVSEFGCVALHQTDLSTQGKFEHVLGHSIQMLQIRICGTQRSAR